jgi:N-methylhydantoinase A/oxoprolinase/acetone carboxylase beta subunit
MIAFGGAAPIHAARLAEKLGISRIMVPSGAGVGSAVGFLMAPVAYEVVRSRYVQLDADKFDPAFVNRLFAEMRAEAEAVVKAGAPNAKLVETRTADMRYRGQGHEIAVDLPKGEFTGSSREKLIKLYEAGYAATFGRTIPGLSVEIMNWTLRLAAEQPPVPKAPPQPADVPAKPRGKRSVYDAADQDMKLGVQRVVVREPPRDQPVRPAKQHGRACARECAPLRFESAQCAELADYRDFDRHPALERITPCERLPVAVLNAYEIHTRCNAWRVPVRLESSLTS